MKVFIDASNIIDGGGITHLREILNYTKNPPEKIHEVTVCGYSHLLKQLKNKDWLTVIEIPERFNFTLGRLYFRLFMLQAIIKTYSPNVLFSPGGTLPKFKAKKITMCRNMLPFEPKYWKKAGLRGLRYLVLRIAQIRSFKKADGVIFLSDYAYETVSPLIGNKTNQYTVIPHGVTKCFYKYKNGFRKTKNNLNRLELVYVSPFTFYKNHYELIQAIIRLRQDGYDISINLVGNCSKNNKLKLEELISSENESFNDIIKFYGKIDQKEIALLTSMSDIFVFASSCENFPNTLLEGMATGSLILCSNIRPMKDILLDGGIYFDPTSSNSIYKALKNVICSKKEYFNMMNRSRELSLNYSWEKCSEDTWKFLIKDLN